MVSISTLSGSHELGVVSRKLCSYVDVNPNTINIIGKHKTYYWKSIEDEQEFIKWMTFYILQSKDARESFCTYPELFHDKDYARKFAENFAFKYGWKHS